MNIRVCQKTETGDFMIHNEHNVVFLEDWIRLARPYIYM